MTYKYTDRDRNLAFQAKSKPLAGILYTLARRYEEFHAWVVDVEWPDGTWKDIVAGRPSTIPDRFQ